MATFARNASFVLALALGASAAWAKLPPPPPMDDKAKAAAEEKKAAAAASAEKAKAELGAAMDRAVKNRDANLRKMGKPVPKPTAVAAAAPAKPAEKAKAKK